MYRPLIPSISASRSTTTIMAPKGENRRDNPQLLDVSWALEISNYLITGKDSVEKRGGLDLKHDFSTTSRLKKSENWQNNFKLVAYGTTLSAYNISTDTETVIKNDFVQDVSDIAIYGDYAIIASPANKLGRVTMELDYDGQTGNFTAGLKITGAISGATAIILNDTDGGATGTLVLGSVSGTFQDDEVITDTSTGSADVNGTLSFTYTEISGAPMAARVTIFGNRCVAGRLFTEPSAVQYSDIDTGAHPPFDNWTTGNTNVDKGDLIYYRQVGKVNSIVTIGKSIVVIFADRGKWAFSIDQIDLGGTASRQTTNQMYLEDAGGKVAISTNDGIFFANNRGLWLMTAIAREDIKYSDQSVLKSDLLGNDYFDDVDLDNAVMTKDDRKNTVLLSVAKNSTNNNFIITFNTKEQAFGNFKGWSIDCFMNEGVNIYAGGLSKLWEIFKNNDDDGQKIWTRFYQELNVGDPNARKMMVGQYMRGELSPSTSINVGFDMYDKNGFFVRRKTAATWVGDSSDKGIDEYGSAIWGDAVWGGDTDTSGAQESYAGGRLKIRNFQRIRIDLTEKSKVPHKINYISLITREKRPIRKRNLTY